MKTEIFLMIYHNNLNFVKNKHTMELTNVEYLRLIHLIELGVSLEMTSEALSLSEMDTVKFLTEWYTYTKIVDSKLNLVESNDLVTL